MKKTILFVVLSTLFLTSIFCQPITSQQKLVQKTSKEQIKSIAKQYNLQDSVVMEKNSFLTYLTKEEVQKWCQEQKAMIEYRKARVGFSKDSKQVRNRSDYFRLLDTYPMIKQKVVAAHGGEVAFQKFKQASLKRPWRIYRSSKGELSFVNGDSPISDEELAKKQQRVDNLPKE